MVVSGTRRGGKPAPYITDRRPYRDGIFLIAVQELKKLVVIEMQPTNAE